MYLVKKRKIQLIKLQVYVHTTKYTAELIIYFISQTKFSINPINPKRVNTTKYFVNL